MQASSAAPLSPAAPAIVTTPAIPAIAETPAPAAAAATPAAPAAPQATPSDSGQDKFQRYRQAAEQEFRAADANNDGFLSQDEMRSRFPYLAKEFQRIDSDGDGRVSPLEYFQVKKLMIERRFAK